MPLQRIIWLQGRAAMAIFLYRSLIIHFGMTGEPKMMMSVLGWQLWRDIRVSYATRESIAILATALLIFLAVV